MNHSSAQLMEFPDELLLIILKKLDNIDALYSLMGQNTRLDQILRDPCFTTKINFIIPNDDTSTQVDTLLDRFCLEILPKIHHLIRRLQVQSTAMERILLAADYWNLSHLDIFITDKEPALRLNGVKTLHVWSSQSYVHEHIHFCSASSVDTLWIDKL